MRCSHPVLKLQRSPVQPNRKNLGLIGPPQPTAVQEHPLGDRVLEHLEKWGYHGEGDSFGELVLRDQTLRRLEEAICIDHGDNVGFPPNRDAGTELRLIKGDIAHYCEMRYVPVFRRVPAQPGCLDRIASLARAEDSRSGASSLG